MDVALLGELEVRDGGRPVVVAGAKLRALLAVLALHAGRAVPAEQLVDALWGDEPPAAVRNGLQGLVSKLRRALGSGALVGMRGGGYALEVPPEAVDVHRFERLVAEGRAAAAVDRSEQVVERMQAAEALWRGDALAEFAYEAFAAVEMARLGELRVAAAEERLDHELRLGHHALAIADLEALVAVHPLRERLRGLLMVALYRAGRQADALSAYQDARRTLGEELGLDPGPDLRQLEAAILAQDPALDGPTGTPAAADRVGSRERRTTVTVSLTPLVGRDRELADLGRLFDDHRFLTLVGPGGVGKTRLALELARSREAALGAGACLVELAPVGDPAGVRAAIAAALDLPDPGRLAEMIGDRELLVVLDNCEHVIATAAEVAEDLLRRCPALHLVATSREGLRVGGEIIWPVPPLAIADAVELFLARARAAGAPLASTEDLTSAVADICRRLDGLPLAIELAAARARAFPVAQIASRLEDRFRLLTGGSRTALPRQQTLRAVVDWSYELLFHDEQRVFERLSVFPGGCDLATAEAVCADETLGASELADIVVALVDKSLVIAVPDGDDRRYSLLQTLAQYGREKLAERGDAERVRDAMAAHYARLCARSAAAFSGEEQRVWLTTVMREQDNLRGALEWAVAAGNAETALTIAGGAGWPHWLAGTAVEGKRWLDDAFRCEGGAGDRARALALTSRGVLGFQLGGAADAVDADLSESLAISRRLGDLAGLTLTYSFYAEVAAARGDVAEGRRRRIEVLDHYCDRPDAPMVLAARAYSRAKLAVLDGDLATGERCYREAADGFRGIDRPMMLSMCLGMVADFDERAADYTAAIARLEEAVAINDAFGLRGFTGALLTRLGWALLQAGDASAAEARYDRALELARRLEYQAVVFLALTGHAALYRRQGRDDDAVEAAVEALELYLAGSPRRLANRVDARSDVLASAAVCCGVLAGVAVDRGDDRRAAWLLGHTTRLRGDAGTSVPVFQRDDLDRTLVTARDRLGVDAFAAAVAEGSDGELGRDRPLRA